MYTNVLIMAVTPLTPNQQLIIVNWLTNCYRDVDDYDEDEDDDGQFEEWAMGKQLGGEES